MPRALTIAVYVWSINAMTLIINSINPFHTGILIAADFGMVNATAAAANVTAVSGIGIFGLLLEFVNIINLLLQLVLGPFIYVPNLLNLLGVTGILHTIIIAAVWIPWALFLFGVITGRALKEMM